MPENALTLRFEVIVDHQVDLGNWTKCEGLTVEWEIQEYREGGLNDFVHRLPGRRKYQNIKLTRPVDAASRQVAAWISRVEGPTAGHTAQIAILDASGEPVAVWNVIDIWPTRWTGPNMDVNGKDTAFETLELAHNGFSVA
jgi:phage tail-like protein